ncbi:MAG: hypothetical protein RDV48_08255 [Candidatus Eremiobacteraeota bacterium]|nr:hypothetical protein [Candidatus Eremiobacteraeota bacterium]
MAIEIRFATENESNKCNKILVDLYGKNYYGVDARFIKWKKASPFKLPQENANSLFMIAVENSNVLALQSFLPSKVIVEGKEFQAIWTTEWINISNIKGLGRNVFRALQTHANINCFFGANSFSANACTKIGWEIINNIERMLYVINKEKLCELFGYKPKSEQFYFVNEKFPFVKDVNHFVCEDINIISDRYFSEAISRFSSLSYRGLDFIEWRYYRHPYLKYFVISLDAYGKSGIAVLRVEQVKDSSLNVVRVLDILPSRGFEEDLAIAIITFGKKNNAVLVDFFCVSSKYARELCPFPYLGLDEHISYDIPMLFQPIEVRERKSINFAIDMPSCPKGFDLKSFYATKSDAEQDVALNDDYKTPII